MPLLVSLARERVIYLALELDRSWTETAALIIALLLAILILLRPKKRAAVSDETTDHDGAPALGAPISTPTAPLQAQMALFY